MRSLGFTGGSFPGKVDDAGGVPSGLPSAPTARSGGIAGTSYHDVVCLATGPGFVPTPPEGQPRIQSGFYLAGCVAFAGFRVRIRTEMAINRTRLSSQAFTYEPVRS
jgi:hypothetical protein